jgi:hypothetical protein
MTPMRSRLWLIPSVTALLLCVLTATLWFGEVEAPSEKRLIKSAKMQLEIGLERKTLDGTNFFGMPKKGHFDSLLVGFYRPFSPQMVGPFNPSEIVTGDGPDHIRVTYSEESANFCEKWIRLEKNLNVGLLRFQRYYPHNFAPFGPPDYNREFVYGVSNAIAIPFWVIKLLALLPCWSIATRVYHMLKSRKIGRMGRCSVCGYDLRATPNRCPECGNRPIAGDAPLPVASPGTPDFGELSRTGEG